MSRRQESQRPGRSSRSIAQDDMEDYIQQVTRYDPELYGRELENVHTQYKTDMVRAIENCPSLLELVPATNSIQDRLVGNFRMIQSQQLEEERFFARGHHIFDQFLKTAKVPVPSCWVVSMPQLPSRGTLLAASDGYEATISHTPLYDHPHDNATTTDLPGPQLDIYARIHESRDEPDGIHSGASQSVRALPTDIRPDSNASQADVPTLINEPSLSNIIVCGSRLPCNGQNNGLGNDSINSRGHPYNTRSGRNC